MNKSLIHVAFFALSAMVSFAQNKVTFAAVEESLTVMSPSPRTGLNLPSADTVVLSTDIVLSENGGSDLLITPSMVTAILSRTENDGSRGPTETATASQSISVIVRVDGVVARPGRVVYDNIVRTVTTKFGGVIPATCTTLVGCTLTDEQLIEVLNEMGARSFNFFLKNVPKGRHRVEVSASFTNGDVATPTTSPVPPVSNPFASATSSATIGPRTLTITAIRSDRDEERERDNRSGQSVSHLIDRTQ